EGRTDDGTSILAAEIPKPITGFFKDIAQVFDGLRRLLHQLGENQPAQHPGGQSTDGTAVMGKRLVRMGRTEIRKTVPGFPPFLRSAPGNAWPKPLHPRAAYFPAELPVSIPSPRRKGCEDPLPGASGCRFPRRRPRIPILRFAPS